MTTLWPRCRNLLAAMLLAWLAVFPLCSCGGDDDGYEPTKETTHTLLVCYPWTGSADGQRTGLLAAFRNSVNLITSTISQHQGTGSTSVLLFFASSPNEATLSRLSYADGRVVQETLRSYNGFRNNSTADLTRLLNDAASCAPAQSYSLIVGCHGTGWLPAQTTLRTMQWKAFGGTTTSQRTEVEQLDSAITASAMRRLHYLCFDGCYMANIETAYALRHSVNYLVASTSELMNYGLPYDKIWEQLVLAQPNWNYVLNRFLNFYESYNYPYGALSVTDCTATDEAATLLRQLNSEATASGVDPSELSVQPLDGYSTHVFFDLGDYLSKLIAAMPSSAVSATQASNLMARLVYGVSTKRLYSVYLDGGGTFDATSNHGITISDPTTSTYALPCLGQTEWWKATH